MLLALPPARAIRSYGAGFSHRPVSTSIANATDCHSKARCHAEALEGLSVKPIATM